LAFGTESDFDFVEVYDGPSSGGIPLGSFSGTSLPVSPLTATSGSMYIEFYSDEDISATGWSADFTTEFSTIGIIGSATPLASWDTDVNMSRPDPIGQPHIWVTNMDLTGGEVKFRAGDSWTTNWGDQQFPNGRGIQEGPNIPITGGNYNVWFNDLTGEYRFTETSFASQVLSELHGGSSKQWTLVQGGLAIGVGPYAGSFDWWSFGDGCNWCRTLCRLI
jgi:hypothetical protein